MTLNFSLCRAFHRYSKTPRTGIPCNDSESAWLVTNTCKNKSSIKYLFTERQIDLGYMESHLSIRKRLQRKLVFILFHLQGLSNLPPSKPGPLALQAPAPPAGASTNTLKGLPGMCRRRDFTFTKCSPVSRGTKRTVYVSGPVSTTSASSSIPDGRVTEALRSPLPIRNKQNLVQKSSTLLLEVQRCMEYIFFQI